MQMLQHRRYTFSITGPGGPQCLGRLPPAQPLAPRLARGGRVSSPATRPQHPPTAAEHDGTSAHSSSANSSSPAADLTEVAGRVLQHGNGVARCVLSDPGLEGNPLEFLKQTEAFWKAMKQQQHEPHKAGPTVITTSSSTIGSILAGTAAAAPTSRTTNTPSSSHSSSSSSRPLSFGAAPAATPPPPAEATPSSGSPSSSSSSRQQHSPDFDVVMCGGTLGICVALALQQQGFRVAVVEKRRVEGRLQEWNSSRHEVQVLVDLGLLTQAELESAIVSEFNPIRVGFKGGSDPLSINNVLNIGVCPKTLIATLRSKFEVLGGVIYEQTAFRSGVVGTDGVVVSLMNAAGAPAGVGDTNRPNALQQEQPVQLHSPFGRVHGEAAAAAAGHAPSNKAVPQAAAPKGASRSSHSGSNGGSSRFDRWVAAGSSSNGAGSSSSNHAPADGSSGVTNGAWHAMGHQPEQQQRQQQQQQQRRQTTPAVSAAAAAAAGQAGSSRKAPSKLTCRLLLDCMGHYSPIVKQLRGKAKPDGMVLVVGGCAEYLAGFGPDQNTSADLLYSITDAAADMQLFWEAFPAEGGKSRTTYMFAYSDADPRRPSFEKLLDTYFTLMPAYQGLPSLDSVKFKRVLFGGFPCYHSSGTTPLAPGFDRVLQLGDASASQSPLSFGGFGSLLRHLPRLSGAISHALQDDRLSRGDLAWIHPYQPSLSAAWLFQRSMSLQVGQLQQQEHKQQQGQGHPAQLGVGGCSDSAGSSDAGPATAAAAAAGSAGHQEASAAAAAAAAAGSERPAAARPAATAAAAAAGSERPAAARPAATAAAAAASTGHSRSSSSSQATGSGSSSKSSPSAAAAAASKRPGWLQLPRDHINALLGANFTAMAFLGQRVLKPFLQDTLQLGPLAATMAGMMLVKPLVIARVFVQVGPKVLLGWFGHFAMLATYTLAYHLLRPLKRFSRSYTFRRLLDALQYGSSSDYHYSTSPPVRADSTSSSSSNGALRDDGSSGAGEGKQGVDRRRREVVANNIVPGVLATPVMQQQQQVQAGAA